MPSLPLPDTFAALGDPTRFAIVKRRLQEGELPAGTLHDVADLSAPAMSRALKVLRTAGILRLRIDKQRCLYAIEPASLQLSTIGQSTIVNSGPRALTVSIQR